MFPAYLLVLWTLCNAQIAGYEIPPIRLYDVARGKQSMQFPAKNLSRHPAPPDHSECSELIPEAEDSPAYFILDFRDVYPVLFIRLSVYPHDLRTSGHVRFLLDDNECAMPALTRGVLDVNILECTEALSGRVITIETFIRLAVCSVQVYTCAAGWQGKLCDQPCENGTYGLACRPCNCRDRSEVCSKIDGLCLSGCRNAANLKDYDCFFESLPKESVSRFSHIEGASIKRVPFLPPVRDSNKIVIENSDNSFASSSSCIIFKSEENSRTVSVEINFRPSIPLYRLIVTYCHFNVPVPFSIFVTLNSQPCLGLSRRKTFSTGKAYTLVCQRRGVSGSTLVIKHTSHNLHAPARASVGLSSIRIEGCSSGFFGPECKLRCNCLAPTCHPVTGECSSRLCVYLASGHSCSLVALPQYRQIEMQSFTDSYSEAFFGGLKYKAQEAPQLSFPLSMFTNNQEVWISYWVFILDGIYRIQRFTLHMEESHLFSFRSAEVFTDTQSSQGSYFDLIRHSWSGVGCTREDNHPLTTFDILCVGPARIVGVFIYRLSPHISPTLNKLEIWTCQDGTFGSQCEGVCNCLDEEEVCDVFTGQCSSGCREGFWGLDCQSPCAMADNQPSCWHHCRCEGKGCGPGIVLCEEEKCIPGWMGPSCSISCPSGFYGSGCAEKCGLCKGDELNTTCNFVDGFCEHGCADNGSTPNCKKDHFFYMKSRSEPSIGESFTSIRILVYGLIIAMVAIVLICICVRLFLFNNEGGGDFGKHGNRRKYSDEVAEKIMQDHREYHEEYMRKKVLQKAAGRGSSAERKSFMTRLFSIKTDAFSTRARVMTLPKLSLGGQKTEPKKAPITTDERCKPLEDNTQQNADQKVALWILRQDFNVLIDRRIERLKKYRGDPLHIKESAYSISLTDLTKDELDKLYDEVGVLGIP